MRPVRPSSRQHPQSVYHPASQSHCPSIPRQSVRHPRPSVTRIVRPPSRHSIHDSPVRHPTRQSCATSVRPSVTVRPSVHHPTTSVRLSYITPSAQHTNQSVRPSATVPTSVRHPTRPSDHPPPSHRLYDTPIRPSACTSTADCLTATTTRPPIRLSFPTIHHTHDSRHSLAVVNGEQSRTIHRTHDSSQSLAVVNGEQSRKAKKFHRAFTNYDLLLRALDASHIYLRDFRRVAPPNQGRMLRLQVASVILVELP